MRRHKIDKLFNEKLEGLKVEPHNDLWPVVEGRIQKQKPNRWWIAAAGGALIISALEIYLFTDPQKTITPEPELVTETPEPPAAMPPDSDGIKEHQQLPPRKNITLSGGITRSVDKISANENHEVYPENHKTASIPVLSPVKGDMGTGNGEQAPMVIKKVNITENTNELAVKNGKSPILDGLETALQLKNGAVPMPDIREAKDSLLSLASDKLRNQIQKLKINNNNENEN